MLSFTEAMVIFLAVIQVISIHILISEIQRLALKTKQGFDKMERYLRAFEETYLIKQLEEGE